MTEALQLAQQIADLKAGNAQLETEVQALTARNAAAEARRDESKTALAALEQQRAEAAVAKPKATPAKISIPATSNIRYRR